MSRHITPQALAEFLSYPASETEYRPPLLSTDLERVGMDLRAYDQWLVWEALWEEEIGYPPAGHWSLHPVDPATGEPLPPTHSAAWRSCEGAAAAWEQRGTGGIGFVLTGRDPFVIVEIGEALTESGEITAEAARWVEQLASYTEVTPTGRGLCVFLQGHLPPGGRCLGSMELSETDRFVPVTGRHWQGTPPHIEERQAALEALHHEIFPPLTTSRRPVAASGAPPPAMDAELLSIAFRGANGARIEALFRGDTSVVPGDRNAADLALCSMLGFYTGDDSARLDRLFRSSSLYRRKWDERHYTDGSTYGQATVAKALEGCILFYAHAKADDRPRMPNLAGSGATAPAASAAEKRWPTDAPVAEQSAAPEAVQSGEVDAAQTVTSGKNSGKVDPLVLAERKGRAEGLAMREVVLDAREAAELLKVSPRMLRRTIKPWRRFGASASGDRWLLSQLLEGEPVL